MRSADYVEATVAFATLDHSSVHINDSSETTDWERQGEAQNTKDKLLAWTEPRNGSLRRMDPPELPSLVAQSFIPISSHRSVNTYRARAGQSVPDQ